MSSFDRSPNINSKMQLDILGEEALVNGGVIRVELLAERYDKTNACVVGWVKAGIKQGLPITPDTGGSVRPTPAQLQSVADTWADKIRDMMDVNTDTDTDDDPYTDTDN